MTRNRWIALTASIAALVVIVVLFAVNSSIFQGVSAPSLASSGTSTSSTPSTTDSPLASATPSSTSPSPSNPPATSPPPLSPAQQTLARLTLAQRVGQILMVSSPVGGPDGNTLAALNTMNVGNVFLKGRGYGGTQAVAAVVGQLNALVSPATTGGVKQFIATDQKGGLVQIMNGPGFSKIPSAIDQAALGPFQIKADATIWGQQLAAAGVNVNFGPVLDTVPSAAFAPQNAPIGYFGREYGFTPQDVSARGVAAALGFAAGGVAPTVKYFPGLGRVSANTDVASKVTDETTVRQDAFLQPFRDPVASGVRWVMVSNAYYPAIDPQNIAPFSPVVMKEMLRGDLGFNGIIVSDDICDAVHLSPFAVANRGANFIAAGGSMALCTNQALLPAMYQGILARATADPVFAASVDAAALKVLEIKAESGLL